MRGYGTLVKLDEANEYMKGILSVFGFTIVSSLELRTGSKSEKQKAYNHEQTMTAFGKFIDGIQRGGGNKPAPTLTQLIYFNIFKKLSEINKEVAKADHEFYRDKADFIYDTNIGFFKKKLATWIADRQVKKMLEHAL